MAAEISLEGIMPWKVAEAVRKIVDDAKDGAEKPWQIEARVESDLVPGAFADHEALGHEDVCELIDMILLEDKPVTVVVGRFDDADSQFSMSAKVCTDELVRVHIPEVA